MAQYYEGIGRRKESTARVRLMTGSGKFTVNEKDFAAFFTRMGDLEDIMRPFGAVNMTESLACRATSASLSDLRPSSARA